MRRLLMTIFVCFAMCAAHAAELLSKDAFTQEAARTFRISRPHFDVKVTGELEIQYLKQNDPGKASARMYLDNAYQEYRNNPGQLREILKNHIQIVDLTGDARQCIATNIMPTIKDKVYLDNTRRVQMQAASEDARSGAPNKGLELMTEPLVDDLFVLYVIDTPTATESLDSDLLRKCGVKPENLKTLALANLRRKAAGFTVKTEPNLPGIFLVIGDNYYETALLLLNDYWSADRFPTKGEIVVAVPARGRVLAADSADQRAIAGLAGIADGVYKSEPYSLSPALYVRRGGNWVRYKN